MEGVHYGDVLPNRLDHAGRQVVPQLVIDVQLAGGTGGQEGIVDAVSLGYDLLDAVQRRGVIRTLLRSADRLPALPDELVDVEGEGQILFVVGLAEVLAEQQA